MAYNKHQGAGVNPLGHSPFGHEKLEGPKRHHDFHGSDDSVPGKGKGMSVPPQHWEKQYKDSPYQKITPASAFLPHCAKDRPTPHLKVNECDH